MFLCMIYFFFDFFFQPLYLRKVVVLLTLCLGALSFTYLGDELFDVIRLLGLLSSSCAVFMFASPLSVLVSVYPAILCFPIATSYLD